MTFDGKKYDYQGVCKYVLATSDCGVNSKQPTFGVVVQNEKTQPSATVSYTREVYVTVAGVVGSLVTLVFPSPVCLQINQKIQEPQLPIHFVHCPMQTFILSLPLPSLPNDYDC